MSEDAEGRVGDQKQSAFDETLGRLQDELDHFGGALPERNALVWDGYIAALLEYSILTVGQHQRLSDMLPRIADNPVVALFLGHGEGDLGADTATSPLPG